MIATPGHTNDSVSYRIGSAVFVGDSMFMPDFGTARCDFPGGDPELLYDSIQRLLAMPGDTRLFMCHDYMPGGTTSASYANPNASFNWFDPNAWKNSSGSPCMVPRQHSTSP